MNDPPDEARRKYCKANYAQSLWPRLPVSSSNACRWAAAPTDAWTEKTKGKVCVCVCVCVCACACAICMYKPRYLEGFAYCAFPFSSLMKIESAADCHRQGISKLSCKAGSGFVLQMEEHRYAKWACARLPWKRSLKTLVLKQRQSMQRRKSRGKSVVVACPVCVPWICTDYRQWSQTQSDFWRVIRQGVVK